MMKIFTTAQVKEIDDYTIAHEPVSSIDLVERAATAFVNELKKLYGTVRTRVIVFAGQGNNGADALAIARLLQEDDMFEVETYLFNPPGAKLSCDCETNRSRLIKSGSAGFNEVSGGNFYPPVIETRDLVVDGLFGSGLKRPLDGGFAAIVRYINNSGATIVSVDLPSGLFGEDNSGNNPDAIIRANLALTFGFPKLSLLLADAAAYAPEWKVLDIGLMYGSLDSVYSLIEEADAVRALRPRPKFSHKGTFGHALLIAGSRGKLGAALLAARACMRSGAGLLTVHLPLCSGNVLHASLPEAMLSSDKDRDCFTETPDLEQYTAIAAGPGLGQNPASATALESLLQKAGSPMVIDADAINIIAANPPMIDLIPKRSILTPHPKEFDRLAGESLNAYERLQRAMSLSVEKGLTIVLKGAYTVVCTPDGKAAINSSGNSGMATAGSGDALTGVILGLLSTGYEPETAATLGVYLHGLAGDIAAAAHSEESMTASDIISSLGQAFKRLHL